jgi:triose/dihydroxyacetone kinase / FAD-AMP lyase (cyclizing)
MTKPKKIINDPKDSVAEFIDGLLLQYPNHFAKLENHNVVILQQQQQQNQQQSVHLICGGGSGHEPSHAGFIGNGMLSAAVCGGIFASPSVSSILAAIRVVAANAVTTNTRSGSDESNFTPSVLLIVKNYTGDRLNFGMAAEKANQEGIHTSLVVVSDDCALPRTKGITGARGVAGTVLVNKIAGSAAASGKSLSDVVNIAKIASRRIGTLGIALNSVTIPGATITNDRLQDENIIEIGLGIHGEAGMKQSAVLTADEMAHIMISTIQQYGRMDDDDNGTIIPFFKKGDDLCVLVNNLGGVSNFEMSILARSCIVALEGIEFGAKATRVLVGSYMTSFDMQGVSLTLLNLNDQPELIQYLDAPTNAPAWAKCDVWSTPSGTQRPSATVIPEIKVDVSATTSASTPPLTIEKFASIVQHQILNAAQKLSDAEALLTEYDTIVGDGDCGITMQRGAAAIMERITNGMIPVDHPVPMFAKMADAVSESMGGTSGVLIELMLRKMSSTLSRCDTISPIELVLAFQAGVDAVSLYGGASVGSRTMLDALVPAARALIETDGILQAAAIQAREGATSTASMAVATAGRSNYLSEDTLKGTADPGAVAVAIVFESLASSGEHV